MKKEKITEIVEIEILSNIPEEKILSIVDFVVNDFHMLQEGFIDAELARGRSKNQWFMIYHYESMANIKAVEANLVKSKSIAELRKIVVPESVKVSFLENVSSWGKK